MAGAGAALLAAACGDTGIVNGGPEAVPFEEVAWAAELEVDTAAFTSLGALRVRLDEPGDSTAAAAAAGDLVGLYYDLWISTGARVDGRTPAEGEPGLLRVGSSGVIPALNQGVVGMFPGEVRTLLVPPAQGFGRFGAGAVPPESWLVLRLEVVEVVPPES
jgi:FKBP-type peptidyl-prolyl cis-trans isomerase